MCSNSRRLVGSVLTAVVLIRAIPTVIFTVAHPFCRDASVVVTGEVAG